MCSTNVCTYACIWASHQCISEGISQLLAPIAQCNLPQDAMMQNRNEGFLHSLYVAVGTSSQHFNKHCSWVFSLRNTPTICEFTDEGGCIVTETPELL